MDRLEAVKIDKITKRLQQHEEIIIQLLEIIAVTNRKVDELKNQSNAKGLSNLH